jgi:hypothetical protein
LQPFSKLYTCIIICVQAYRNGVFDGCGDQNSTGSDTIAMTAVGYGTDNKTGLDYWLLKNSWGATWGKKGFLHLRRGAGACGIGRQMAVVECAAAPVVKFKAEPYDEGCGEEGCAADDNSDDDVEDEVDDDSNNEGEPAADYDNKK